ncbi:unnamed protein product, partial [Allacma fusca]
GLHTFLRAHKYSKCLQFTSNVETSVSTGEENSNETRKRKRRPNPKYSWSPSGQEIPPKNLKHGVYKFTAHHQMKRRYTSNVAGKRSLIQLYYQLAARTSNPGKEEMVLSEPHSIKSEIIRSADVQNNMSSKPKCPFRKPISSVQELQVAEEVLEEEKESFKFWCISIGGTNAEDHVRRILKQLLLQEFSFEINFTCKYGKKSFKKVRVCNIIIEAVIDSHKTTEQRIEEVIANWFRGARDRNGGRSKRSTNQYYRLWKLQNLSE